MVFMADILEEKENRALQTLKEHFFSLNGKELQLREQGEQLNQYFDDVNGHKVRSWEQGELHLGECSGYALKDGHVVTINLQIDRVIACPVKHIAQTLLEDGVKGVGQRVLD